MCPHQRRRGATVINHPQAANPNPNQAAVREAANPNPTLTLTPTLTLAPTLTLTLALTPTPTQLGGLKQSGFGKFAGVEGLRGCCTTKSVVADRFALFRTVMPPVVQYPVHDVGYPFFKVADWPQP